MANVVSGAHRISRDVLLKAGDEMHEYGQGLQPRVLETVWETKPGNRGAVSALDREAGERAAEITRHVMPDAAVVDEEKEWTHTVNLNGLCEYLDGIDGSNNVQKEQERLQKEREERERIGRDAHRKLKQKEKERTVTGVLTWSTSAAWTEEGITLAFIVTQPGFYRTIAGIRGQGLVMRNGKAGGWKPVTARRRPRKQLAIGLVVSSSNQLRELQKDQNAAYQDRYGNTGDAWPTIYAGMKCTLDEWDACTFRSRGSAWDYAALMLGMHETKGVLRYLSGAPFILNKIDTGAYDDPVIAARTQAQSDELCRFWERQLRLNSFAE